MDKKHLIMYTLGNNILHDPTISLLPPDILKEFAIRILRSLDVNIDGDIDIDKLFEELELS